MQHTSYPNYPLLPQHVFCKYGGHEGKTAQFKNVVLIVCKYSARVQSQTDLQYEAWRGF